MTSSRREERNRRWQERKYHERLGLIVVPIIVVGLIVVYAFALSWATTPSPAFVKTQNEFAKVARANLKLDGQFSKALRAETNAWNQIAAGNKTLAHCYATDTACWP